MIWGGQKLSFLHTVGFLNPFEWAVRLADWDLLHEPGCMDGREQALSIQTWLLLRGDSRSTTIYNFCIPHAHQKNIVIMQITRVIISPFSVLLCVGCCGVSVQRERCSAAFDCSWKTACRWSRCLWSWTSRLYFPTRASLLHTAAAPGPLVCEVHHCILYVTQCSWGYLRHSGWAFGAALSQCSPWETMRSQSSS